MSHRRQTSKLSLASATLKSFANSIQPKLRKLIFKHSLPRSFVSVTRRLFSSLNFPSKLGAIPPNPSQSIILQNHCPHKNHKTNTHQNQYLMNNNFNMKSPSFTAVHVDELSGNRNKETSGTSKRKVVQGRDSDQSVEDLWRAVVAASPQLRCVDERAEEFIFKVRKDMKLQKDKSDLEFQQMLARGTY